MTDDFQVGKFCRPDCEDRHLGCHDTCFAYKVEKAKYAQREKKIREARDEESEIWRYAAACKTKRVRRKR